MVKIKSILTLLAFLFLTHGSLYFFFPEDVHNPESPFKYIKYIILLGFILFSIKENLHIKVLFFILLIPLFVYYKAINSLGDPVNFVAYVMPVYFLFSSEHIKMINWKKVIFFSIIVASLFGYYEILFLKNHFYMYNASKDAYRLVSIFLNPNNLGVSMALLTFSYILLYGTNPVKSTILVINGFLIVFLSVSKTGLIVYGLLTAYVAFDLLVKSMGTLNIRVKYLLYFIFITPFIVFAAYMFFTSIELDKIREISFETLYVRFEGNSNFLDLAAANPLFPWSLTAAELDNAYLNLWGSFGLPLLVVFLFFNLSLLFMVRSKIALLFLLSFWLIGTTTNFLYLWPIGYFYWGLSSIILGRKWQGSKYPESTI